MISSQAIQVLDNGSVALRATTLANSYGLCLDQRFRDQPTAASCSATLIDDDLLVTAGHCLGSQQECQAQRFVLGYQMELEGLAPLSSGDVFSCQQLVMTYDDGQVDYAFVKLDRPVPLTQGEPAPVRRAQLPLQEGDPLVMMGFPSGLPLKIDDGGFVSDPRALTSDFFMATVDAFGGNSGSGVFNASGEQVGILVRGEQDYVQRGRCTVVNELSLDRGPGDSAEEITYLHQALSALCQSGYQSERLCGNVTQGGLCSTCDDTNPCQAGLSCGTFSSVETALTFCAPRCEAGEVCPDGHACVAGQCELTFSRLCDPDTNQVVGVDSCGRSLGVIEVCGEGSYCRRGACLLRGEGDLCSNATELEPVSQTVRGTLAEGYVNSLTGSCAGRGPERFYTFTLEQPNHLRATASGFDTVLYLFSSAECAPELELICDDDGDPNSQLGSLIDLDLDPGVYTLALDSFSLDNVGDYTLSLQLCDTGCVLGETRCEEGGLVSVCDQPPGSSCRGWSLPFSCPDNLTCVEGQCLTPLPGDTCGAQIPLSAPYPEVLEGVITDRHSYAQEPRCASQLSADVNYELNLDFDARVIASYVSGPLSALSLRTACGDAGQELNCAPQVIGAGPLEATLNAGRYTLTLSALGEGPYQVDLRVEPLCVDECELDALRCTDDQAGLERCVLGEQGCATWSFDRQCTGAGGCLAGGCVDECFHECELGSDECVSLDERRGCVLDELGCRRWSPLEPCLEGELCAGDGVCEPEVIAGVEAGVEAGRQAGAEAGTEAGSAGVEAGVAVTLGGDSSPEPSEWVGRARPREVLIPTRARGGCDQGAQPTSPLTGLLLLSLMSLYVRVRRRALI